METIIARLKIQDGKEAEALEKLAAMAKAVEAEEAKTAAYAVHRLKDDPSQIIFIEMYEDDGALGAHMQSPHMGTFRERFGEVFDTSLVKIERLERIGGFVR